MGTGVRQRVEPGDATDRVQSSTNASTYRLTVPFL